MVIHHLGILSETVPTKMTHKMLIPLQKSTEHFAGEAIAKKVMEGSDRITERTDKTIVAQWIKGAMERLDSLADEKTRILIMEDCGRSCAKVNKRLIDSARARRKRFKTVEEFLQAEQRRPIAGTRLTREGNVLFQYYTPLTFRRPMRCYCGLLRGLPEDENVSRTYCYCSEGFVKEFWENVLERPVKVELLQSALSGASECQFAIHL